MNRWTLALLAAATLAASTRLTRAQEGASAGSSSSGPLHGGSSGDLRVALQRYLALPGTKSYLIQAGADGALDKLASDPDRFLFTASAYKTFVLGRYLRDVEAGVLSEDEQVAIDDSVRMFGSPVLQNLAGTTQARSVLDAMISYSDNTATDLATGKVGADRVRALIAELGLSAIRIPDSTRRYITYQLGAPVGEDLGWSAITDILEGRQSPPGPLRPPLNDVITLAGNARDFVSWYEQALQGAVFTKPETQREFKRILAGSVQIPLAVPPDTPAYAKGGELLTTLEFPLNAKSFAGQMVVDQGGKQTPVTFCFIVNWDQSAGDFPVVEKEFFAAIQNTLAAIKQALR